MRAVAVSIPGGPQVLHVREIDEPHLTHDQVLIRVHFAAVNRDDISLRKGAFRFPYGATLFLGFECSGIIESVGKNVSKWKIGDEVCALLDGAGYAEKVAVREGQVFPIPTGVSLREAASLPFAACTVWLSIFITSRLYRGETLLIHGGSGGIDAFAIKAAKLGGSRVIVVAGDEEKLSYCVSIQADVCINYKIEDFAARVKEETGGRGVDVILDCTGTHCFQKNIECLNVNGRLFIIGALGATLYTQMDLRDLVTKRLTVQGGYLQNRSARSKQLIIEDVKKNLWPAIGNREGMINPLVHQCFSFSEADEAHQLVETGHQIGKVLLVP
ncbi:unnamed protein product [Lathyrus sativus]|nr:unnamed protein product [Lathyrus sativus]